MSLWRIHWLHTSWEGLLPFINAWNMLPLSLFLLFSLSLYLFLLLTLFLFSLSLSLSLSQSLSSTWLVDKIISNHKPWEIQDYTVSTINRCDVLILYFDIVWVFFRADYTIIRDQKNYSVSLWRIHWLYTSCEGLPPFISLSILSTKHSTFLTYQFSCYLH